MDRVGGAYADAQREFFCELASQYDADDVRRVGWGSRQSQESRFRVLAEIGDLRHASILDVGCGVGDLYGYLLASGFSGRYAGYDLLPDNAAAAENRYQQEIFFVGDPLADGASQSFDYVFASGLFWLPVERWAHVVADMLRRMYVICRVGVATNFLSALAPVQQPGSYYADPGVVLGLCRSLSTAFSVRHDYRDNDFAVYVYKRETDRA